MKSIANSIEDIYAHVILSHTVFETLLIAAFLKQIGNLIENKAKIPPNLRMIDVSSDDLS